ncbi:MAG: hypothetical protein AAFZ17_02075 [Cyanobacteria bacterium J06650_10]
MSVATDFDFDDSEDVSYLLPTLRFDVECRVDCFLHARLEALGERTALNISSQFLQHLSLL